MIGCKKCTTLCGVLMLVLGVLFLLRDLGMWTFWNVQWWSALLILFGLCNVAMASCKDCQMMCSAPAVTKKK